jgi:hypothetical protein
MLNRYVLVPGDLLTLGGITLMGFATHNELGPSYLPRMAASFLPLTLGWFLIAPWFGLFQKEILENAKQLWRPLVVMLIVGALAAIVRSFVLDTPIIPIFVLVLSTTSAMSMIFWRSIYLIVSRIINKTRFSTFPPSSTP